MKELSRLQRMDLEANRGDIKMLNTRKDKIAFFQKKLEICYRVKAQILPDDPYADVKHQKMDERIKIYKERLAELQPDKLTSWTS